MTALRHRDQLAVDIERPVLVIGVGRSGTSLLQSMLNAHPDLCFPPETHFFRRYVAPRNPGAPWSAREMQRLEERLAGDEDFARAGIAPAELCADPLSAEGPAGVFRALLRRTADAQGKSRVGDKDPKNIDSLRALRRAFPRGLLLHVIRDPRDVLLSRTKAAWSANRPWWMHPLIYREQMRSGRALGRELFGDAYMEIHYEELIGAPEQTLRRICDHIGLSWNPSMLSFGDSAAQLVDPGELSWKRETLGPLLTNNSGKWREGLSRMQIAYTEEICRETFGEFDYESAQPRHLSLRALCPLLRTATALAYDIKNNKRS